MTSKLRILPDQCVFKQGDVGDAAFLILSGSFNVERDEVKVGKISSGEIFGELSLILGEKRKIFNQNILDNLTVGLQNIKEAKIFGAENFFHQNFDKNIWFLIDRFMHLEFKVYRVNII